MADSGQARRSREVAERLIDRLASASQLLSLGPPSGWLDPYAMGFVWRHVHLAYELARHEALVSWFIPHRPTDEEQRRLTMTVVPERLGLSRASFESAYDAATKSAPSTGADPFSIGVAEADRILHRVEASGVHSKDQHTQRIEDLERHFRHLPGRHPFSKLIGLVLPSKFYPFLVAHTLGRSAFAYEPDDAKLSKLLGFS